MIDKITSLRALLEPHEVDAILLQHSGSFAWATGGGRAYINTASTSGAASLLVTGDRLYLITNNIEAGRLLEEEGLAGQGWELAVTPWHAPRSALPELTAGLRVGSDLPSPGMVDLSAAVRRLRSHLDPAEQERFRQLGRICAGAMEATIRRLRPGQSEYEIAALLAEETLAHGALPIVNLVAVDERVYRYRHPLPTEKQLARYAMLVLCGRRWGLVCSLTRLVHFGPLDEGQRRKIVAVAAVDATYILASRPGNTLAQALQAGIEAYAEVGFPDEWQHHHQGGLAGYEPREQLATPHASDPLAAGMACAWNPSIAGVKSEDTILVGEDQNEIITLIPDWPTITVRRPAGLLGQRLGDPLDMVEIDRPDILVIE